MLYTCNLYNIVHQLLKNKKAITRMCLETLTTRGRAACFRTRALLQQKFSSLRPPDAIEMREGTDSSTSGMEASCDASPIKITHK